MSCNLNTEPDGGSWISALGWAATFVASFGVPTWLENVKAKKQKQAYIVKEKEENDQRDRENKEKIKQDLTREPKDLDPLENLLIKRKDIYSSHFKLESKQTQVENMIWNDFKYQEESEIIFSNVTVLSSGVKTKRITEDCCGGVPGRQEE